MPPRLLRMVLVSILAWVAMGSVAASAEQPRVLTIEGPGQGLAELGGLWQFHVGDNPQWASPGIDDAAGQDGWEQVGADRPWSAYGHAGYTGMGWYRRHIRVTSETPKTLVVYLEGADCSYEVYWNGVLIGGDGRLPPRPEWKGFLSHQPRIFEMGGAREGVLALRMWRRPLLSFDSDTGGGLLSVPLLGSPEAIAGEKAESDYYWLRAVSYWRLMDLLFALAVLISLLTWWGDRSQLLLLWTALFFLFPLLIDVLFILRMGYPSSGSFGPNYSLLSTGDLAFWLLMLWLLGLNHERRFIRLTLVLGVADVTMDSISGWILNFKDWSAPSFPNWALASDLLANLCILIGLIYPLVLIGYGVRRRLDPTRWVFAVSAALFVLVYTVGDVSQQASRSLHWSLADKINTPLFFVAGASITMRAMVQTLLFLSVLYTVYRYLRDATRRRNLLEQEFKSARELQQVLIPEALPEVPGYALTSAYRPAMEVGGDFFQILPLQDGSTLILLGDVSGKGLKAAMAVSLIVGMIRALANDAVGPAELLAQINQRLCDRMQNGFATCVALCMDGHGGMLIASAGHPAPFLNQREVDLSGALPLGLIQSGKYQEIAVELREGDQLSLYTDGLLEARNPQGELYGFERLKTLFGARPDATRAMEAAIAFGQDDDITVLTLTRLAAGEKSTTQLDAPNLSRP